MHISKGFNWKDSKLTEKEFLSVVQSFDNFFINPVRLNTAFAEIIHPHIANFGYVSKMVDFEYFAMSASNELFVRIMPPISDCDLCANISRSYISLKSEYWYKKVIDDQYIYKIVDYLGGAKEDICKSQIEGSFYRKELFKQIIDVINQIYPYEEIFNQKRAIYPREEFYFSTIARILNKTAHFKVHQPNYTFVAWGNKSFLPTHEQIIEVAQGKMNGRYSVKRVSRNLDDTERIFIGTQIGNYRQEAINLMINAKGNRQTLTFPDTDDFSLVINTYTDYESNLVSRVLKVLIFVSGKDRSSLKPALNKLAQLYPNKELKIIGSAGVYTINDIPYFQTNDISKQNIDLVVVTGGSVDINGVAPDVHFGDVLNEMKRLNIPEDKIILDRVLAIPNFTFDKYRQLKESRPTIFAANCFGGVLYHRFGLKFFSPTINMFIGDNGMVNFLSDLRKCIESDLQFQGSSSRPEMGYNYPIFNINGNVTLYMNHYGKYGAEFAESKWNERKARINWDNIIAFNCTENPKILEAFDKLPIAKKFCFVPFPSDKPSAVYLDPALDLNNGNKMVIGDLTNRFGLGYNKYNYDLWDMLLYGRKSTY